MEITLKNIKKSILYLENGKKTEVEYLGKGRFSTCYKTSDTVYTFTNEHDYSKEAISMWCDTEIKHIPKIEYVGDSGLQRVYKMPLYKKLMAKNKKAWEQYKELQRAENKKFEFIQSIPNFNWKIHGLDIMHKMIDIIQNEEIKEALTEIRNGISNYGLSYCFEFPKRNLVVDENDDIILLDVVFNTELIKK